MTRPFADYRVSEDVTGAMLAIGFRAPTSSASAAGRSCLARLETMPGGGPLQTLEDTPSLTYLSWIVVFGFVLWISWWIFGGFSRPSSLKNKHQKKNTQTKKNNR